MRAVASSLVALVLAASSATAQPSNSQCDEIITTINNFNYCDRDVSITVIEDGSLKYIVSYTDGEHGEYIIAKTYLIVPNDSNDSSEISLYSIYQVYSPNTNSTTVNGSPIMSNNVSNNVTSILDECELNFAKELYLKKKEREQKGSCPEDSTCYSNDGSRYIIIDLIDGSTITAVARSPDEIKSYGDILKLSEGGMFTIYFTDNNSNGDSSNGDLGKLIRGEAGTGSLITPVENKSAFLLVVMKYLDAGDDFRPYRPSLNVE